MRSFSAVAPRMTNVAPPPPSAEHLTRVNLVPKLREHLLFERLPRLRERPAQLKIEYCEPSTRPETTLAQSCVSKLLR
jgi:hypothetical protein